MTPFNARHGLIIVQDDDQLSIVMPASEAAARITMERVEGLGQERTAFPLIAHTLPPSTSVDGVLGLDFFRDRVLTLDFRSGMITLA